ncbi:MAG: hypothetical protein MZV70_10560 [Desulfobacterales bacterium]|nr:hypothetical protein [Desulfobacterales bacterium]
MANENPEHRSAVRLTHDSPVRLEQNEVGILHEARMFNYSSSGLYFESDYYLVPGTEIFIGLKSSPFAGLAQRLRVLSARSSSGANTSKIRSSTTATGSSSRARHRRGALPVARKPRAATPGPPAPSPRCCATSPARRRA